ncbi:MAG: hypothetical protein HLUCCA11_21780 [Phormidesmis priestleyi Ana]|uniref:Uncharacterized protein n=1 Tax=Phormidesmis priestleyi Ana TaxID=1666911 RepID=A0A0P7YPK8_9CYAN|nr:MAG: hypothetical protein HLUCCA11_21780 [Phormidesmis priestleyi Ana]
MVDLSVAKHELESAKTYLSQQVGSEVSLVAIPWLSATAACNFPGGSSVVAHPSNLADNAATIQFDLTVDQLRLLKQALSRDQGDQFFSMVYRLTVDSVQPALDCSLHADFRKYHELVKQQLKIGIPFFNFSKTDTYETLEKSRAITVNCINKQTESTETLKLAALSFFQSFLTPLPQFQKSDDSSEDGQWVLGYQYQKERDKQIFQKEVDVVLNTQSGIRQSVHIQGLIQGVQAAYKSTAISTIEVGARAPFQQTLTVTNYADFKRDLINIVVVRFYDDDNKIVETLTYREDSERSQTVSLSYLNRDRARYYYDIEIYLVNTNHLNPPKSSKKALSYSESLVAIIPREFYSVIDIDLQTTDDFPWKYIASVAVCFRQAAGKTYQLKKHQPQKGDTIVLNQPAFSLYTFKISFQPLDSSIGSQFSITRNIMSSSLKINPFKRRVVTLQVRNIDWEKWEKVQVRIKCEQKNKALNGSSTFDLTVNKPQADFEYYRTQEEQLSISGQAYFKFQNTVVAVPIPKTTSNLIEIDEPPQFM